MNLINRILEPRTTNPADAFRERLIRVIVVTSQIFFACLAAYDLYQGFRLIPAIWYSTYYGVSLLILLALHGGRVNLAARITILGMLLLVIDPTVSYWSPGMIIISLMLTFIYQLIMPTRRDMAVAVAINLSIYSYQVFFNPQPSPLYPTDYYSDPLRALAATTIAHLFIIGITLLIRHDQHLRGQRELLLEQQRVDVLRQFLGHASHDLRNLLARTTTDLYVLTQKLPASERNFVESIDHSIHDLEKLLLSMLDMAQLDDTSDFELEYTSINTVLDNLVQSYRPQAEAKSQILTFPGDTKDAWVSIDRQHINRAIGNILDNAIAYTPDSGNITITTHRRTKHVLITVTDTGAGIPPDKLPYIFDSFYRGDEARSTSTGINGLGLAISKKIVALHGGTLSVKSEVDAGSTFSITLPLA